jgi:3-isopropylmalate/(R)-2-methylmalate dehydratase small subunit
VSEAQLSGRVWLFAAANLDTDLMMPGATFRLPFSEQVKLVFSANRPGWYELVKPGDIIVAGPNFGTGSARPAPSLFKRLGISAIVAESFSDLFFRNCVNYALPAMACPGICSKVVEGDELDLDLRTGRIRNRRTGVEHHGTALPPMLAEIIAMGGLIPRLRAQGYIA